MDTRYFVSNVVRISMLVITYVSLFRSLLSSIEQPCIRKDCNYPFFYQFSSLFPYLFVLNVINYLTLSISVNVFFFSFFFKLDIPSDRFDKEYRVRWPILALNDLFIYYMLLILTDIAIHSFGTLKTFKFFFSLFDPSFFGITSVIFLKRNEFLSMI